MSLKAYLKQSPKRERIPEMTKEIKMSGGSKLFDDAVTVQINMKEATPDPAERRNILRKLAASHNRSMEKGTPNEENSSDESPPSPKMEVKITINMKQLERHHREIDSYISPFTPSPDSIFLRIPPRPEDYARIENARDELDKLVRYVHRLTPNIIPEQEAKEFLQKLRRIDVRLTALYPRPPAPGDKEKKSYRMCPCYEPEMEDIENLIINFDKVFRGMSYLYQMEQQLDQRETYLMRMESRQAEEEADSPSQNDETA